MSPSDLAIPVEKALPAWLCLMALAVLWRCRRGAGGLLLHRQGDRHAAPERVLLLASTVIVLAAYAGRAVQGGTVDALPDAPAVPVAFFALAQMLYLAGKARRAFRGDTT